MVAADDKKTAFKSKYGNFQILVMPMGVGNAPGMYHSLMNRIFSDQTAKLVVIVDEIIIYSDTRKDLVKRLGRMFEVLQKIELYVGKSWVRTSEGWDRMFWLTSRAEGHTYMGRMKRVVKEGPTSTAISELHSFLGLLQVFRRFIHKFCRS